MNDLSQLIVVALGMVIAASSSGVIWRYIMRLQSIPRAYNIAVIGFPQSGKTCLITSMFGELFANRIAGVNTVPRGKETIERINTDLEKLEMGRVLGPTTDQDLFAYRAELVLRDFPFMRRIKLEIGDFPGEHSKEFAEQASEWFHESEYFKWAMEADAFIFVVDLGHMLIPQNRDEYTARIKKAIRAAWHHLLEYHLVGQKNIRRKRVVLVFTKTDLLAACEQETSSESSQWQKAITEMVMKLGFGETLPKPFPVDHISEESISLITDKFSDLSRHLSGQCRLFEIVFSSVVAYDEDGRLGIRKLLKALLPT